MCGTCLSGHTGGCHTIAIRGRGSPRVPFGSLFNRHILRIMPPKLSSRAPDTLHNIVTRSMMAVLGLGALTVILDPGSVKSYDNEVEYAKAKGEELRGRRPHRCNDRLEDFIQVHALYGSDQEAHMHVCTCSSHPCTQEHLLQHITSSSFGIRSHAPAAHAPVYRHLCCMQALAGEEASTFRDFMPTARVMFRCFMSKPG